MRTFLNCDDFNAAFWEAYATHYTECFHQGFTIGFDLYCNFGGM